MRITYAIWAYGSARPAQQRGTRVQWAPCIPVRYDDSGPATRIVYVLSRTTVQYKRIYKTRDLFPWNADIERRPQPSQVVVTKDSLMPRQYPLVGYATEHWFEHARFEGVSQNVIEGMKRFIDRTKPHFAIWLWILSSWKWWGHRAEKPFHPCTLCYRDVLRPTRRCNGLVHWPSGCEFSKLQ